MSAAPARGDLVELFPFLLIDVVVGVFATSDERERRRREREQARHALDRVAASLGGRIVRPWFGSPRVEARIDGREVVITWLGEGHVEVTGPAPDILEVWATPGRWGWLGRLLGWPEISVGGASADHHAPARSLVASHDLDRVEARHGRIRARGRAGASAPAILTLAEQTLTLAWGRVPDRLDGRVRAQPRGADPAAREGDATKPRVEAAAAATAGLRCPYCHDDLAPDAVVVHCASCDAPHHPTCFEEGRGCSIAGCAQRAARGVRARA